MVLYLPSVSLSIASIGRSPTLIVGCHSFSRSKLNWHSYGLWAGMLPLVSIVMLARCNSSRALRIFFFWSTIQSAIGLGLAHQTVPCIDDANSCRQRVRL